MNRCKPRWLLSEKKAFTLTEVVFSLVILLLGVLTATMFLNNLVRATGLSENVTRAVGIAQKKIEEIVQQKASARSSGSAKVETYTLRWIVASDGTSTTVRVTVAWDDVTGSAHSVDETMTF